MENNINAEERNYSTIPSSEKQIRGVVEQEVKRIYLNVYEKFGNIEGYIIFRDNDGNLCAPDGTLTLSVEKTSIQKKWKVAAGDLYSKPVDVPVVGFGFLKKVSFNNNDFKLMVLRSGDEIYALPISLPSEKVEPGDKVTLEWSRFKVEQRVR